MGNSETAASTAAAPPIEHPLDRAARQFDAAYRAAHGMAAFPTASEGDDPEIGRLDAKVAFAARHGRRPGRKPSGRKPSGRKPSERKPSGRKPSERTGPGHDTTMRRFGAKERRTGYSRLPFDHPALAEARTRYAQMVVDPLAQPRVLRSGHHQKKIGARVLKGRWAGMPIYTLTLEERATCPESCRLWADCYGNKMHWPRRNEPGPALELRLEMELAELQARWPDGFVIRVHILGDFYSLAYAHRWAEWLCRFQALRVWGYTAHGTASDIGHPVEVMSRFRWDRWAVRFSNSGLARRATTVVERPEDAPADAIVCPAQTGRTDCCGTCGLCWQTDRNIAFLAH